MSEQEKISEIHRTVIQTSKDLAVAMNTLSNHKEKLDSHDKEFFDTDVKIQELTSYKNKTIGGLIILSCISSGLLVELIHSYLAK